MLFPIFEINLNHNFRLFFKLKYIHMKPIKLFFTIIIFIFMTACNDKGFEDDHYYGKVLKRSDLSSLPGKKVYFGHQSVGYNILEGIKKITAQNEELDFIKILTLEEYKNNVFPENDSLFYFIHSKIGTNTQPDLKIKDFQDKLDSLKGLDAAFMKFCFVDITRKTEVNTLFNNYIEAMDNLEERYINTKYLYFTCPISIRENLVIGILKEIMQTPDDLNKNRNKFNNLLRAKNNIELFDIAYLEANEDEASEPQKREFMKKKYATSDGGHLNEYGSEKIGYYLLVKLNNLLK